MPISYPGNPGTHPFQKYRETMTNDFCIPQLLREFALRQATGTLLVRAPYPAALLSTVLFEEGVVVFAKTRHEQDPTGDLFLEILEVPSVSEDAEEHLWYENQVAQTVLDLFNWGSAEFDFHDGIGLNRWPRLPLPVGDLFLRGLRAVRDTSRVEAWIGDLDRVLGPGPDPFGFFETATLTPEEVFFATRFDRRTSLRDMLSCGYVEREKALRLVAAFLFAGVLETVDVQATRPLAEQQPVAPPPAPAYDPALVARFWYVAESKLRALEDGADHYALLEVGRRATQYEVDAAYEEHVRAFTTNPPPGVAEHFGLELDRILSALASARAVLLDPAARAEYDRELAAHDRGVRVDGNGKQTATFGEHSSSPSPRERAEPVAEPAVTKVVLGRVTAAAEMPSLTPEEWIERAKQYIGVSDYERAVQALERAIEGLPGDPLAHLLLGRALSSLPDQLARAEGALARAAALAPRAATPHVELGRFYRRVGRLDEARASFELALTLRPDDEKARAALAEVEAVLHR